MPGGWLTGPELAAAPAFAQVSFGVGFNFTRFAIGILSGASRRGAKNMCGVL